VQKCRLEFLSAGPLICVAEEHLVRDAVLPKRLKMPPPSFAAVSTSWGATSLAGFQVSTTGRFWVSTEAGYDG
jgi:hypothetical protein